MIFIIEQSIKENDGHVFSWKGSFFKDTWNQKTTWRFMWGIWSISYYQADGLKHFFDYIRSNNTTWVFPAKKKSKNDQIAILWEALKEQHSFRVEDELNTLEKDESWSILQNRVNEEILGKGE